MAMMDASGWTTQDQSLPTGGDDDFQQFLDMGSMGGMGESLQFDFQDFGAANGGSMMQQNHREQMDTQMGGTENQMVMAVPSQSVGPGPQNQHQHQHQQHIAMSSAASHPSIPAHQIIQMPPPQDTISDIDAQIQFLQQQRLQHQQRQLQEQQVHAQQQAAFYARQNQVPPTPQSLEMPPNSGQFYSQDQRQQNVFDSRYQRMKEQQDMAFTPLVSPAVTPIDPHFHLDHSFLPAAYFSPLTSPALHAQSEANSPYDHRNSISNSISNHNSPGEMDLEHTAPTAPTQPLVDLSKKARKNNASRAKGKGSVRQSPITKPMKKRTVPTPKMVSQALTEMQEAQEDMLPTTLLPAAMSSESENASVSPETLSDMPPPPPPMNKMKSPLAGPQQHPQAYQQVAPAFPPHVQGKPSPATPASLMKLPSSSSAGGGAVPSTDPLDLGAADSIEHFALPESANFKNQLPQLDTNQTPTQSPMEPSRGRATSTFQPLPSPIFAKPMSTVSATASPNLAPGSVGPTARRTPQLAPRGSKKRASVSSVHVSPALRPKISPHIKPLLPGTPGMSAEDSARSLLMSKSNYQNILEGTVVPGVVYPTELSDNLTSKRTSHKIAEQGRRNRINSALQEIAALLPPSVNEPKVEVEEKKDAKGNATPSSKANTVELAIEYIKQLKQEVAEANARAEEAEKKLGIKEKS
ncbi:phosphorus acquisition-controlling protein [Plectosphaerella plurivora]|uniref:Phosphorus acquisition-controlling protein n=1 Tax=Plectosphaerella plurivora TaxID=936078 RepID=A0A9P9AC82_9PEZI|nr:phosphorus acquisition-controlling protein [Plectosphaerella plurivora]